MNDADSPWTRELASAADDPAAPPLPRPRMHDERRARGRWWFAFDRWLHAVPDADDELVMA